MEKLTNYEITALESLRDRINEKERSMGHALEDFDSENTIALEMAIAKDKNLSIALEEGINILDKLNGWIGDKASDWTVNMDSAALGRAASGHSESARKDYALYMSKLKSAISSIKDNKTYTLKLSAPHTREDKGVGSVLKTISENSSLTKGLALAVKAIVPDTRVMLGVIEKMKQNSDYDKKDYYEVMDKYRASTVSTAKKVFPKTLDTGKGIEYTSNVGFYPTPGILVGEVKNGIFVVRKVTQSSRTASVDIVMTGKQLKELATAVAKGTAGSAMDSVSSNTIEIEKMLHKYGSNWVAVSAFRKIKLGAFYINAIVASTTIMDSFSVPLVRCFKTEMTYARAILKAI